MASDVDLQGLRNKPTIFLPDNSGELYFLHRFLGGKNTAFLESTSIPLGPVEVRGVEPRSAKFSVSNSPSAAAGGLSARRITAAISVQAHPESA